MWTYRAHGDREVHPWDPSSLTSGRKTKPRRHRRRSGKSLGRKPEPIRSRCIVIGTHCPFDEDKRLKGLETRRMRSSSD